MSSEYKTGYKRGKSGKLYSESPSESLSLSRKPSQTKERDRGFRKGKEDRRNKKNGC